MGMLVVLAVVIRNYRSEWELQNDLEKRQEFDGIYTCTISGVIVCKMINHAHCPD
jgi:hypothetical protein